MPMIDITVPENLLSAKSETDLTRRATESLLHWEGATGNALVTSNTGAYLHFVPQSRATAGGAPDHVVRIDILTPPGSLTQAQRQGMTEDLTALVKELAGGTRAWVLFREAVDGGWGIGGRAFTNREIGEAVKASARGKSA